MRRSRLFAIAGLLALWPGVARAQGGLIDFLESWSGPGPFHPTRPGYSVRLFCVGVDRPVIACLNDAGTNRIKAVLVAEGAWYDSDHNPRFADTPTDTSPIDLQKHGFTFMYRVSPSLDIGAGLGWMQFSAPDFGNVNKWLLMPLTVSYIPFGFVHADSADGWTRFGRILRLRYALNYLPQGISASEFKSKESKYFKSGDVARSFAIVLDFGSYFKFP